MGKNFLVQSLCDATIMAGYTNRSFRFPDPLTLDDQGLHRLTRHQLADLCQFIVSRHRVSSFVITPKRAMEE